MKFLQTYVMFVTNWKMKTYSALDHQLIKFCFATFFLKIKLCGISLKVKINSAFTFFLKENRKK